MRIRVHNKFNINHRVVIYPILLALVNGCGLSSGQKLAITNFTPAASSLGDIASTQFVLARESVIQLNTCLLYLDTRQIPVPDPNSQRRLDWDHLDDSLTADRISIYVKAAELIKSYSESIEALVADNENTELTASANKLTASIRSYDTAKSISDDQLSAIDKTAVAIGGLLVEQKKLDALKEIIPPLNGVINTISSTFKTDFDVNSPGIFYTVNFTADKLIGASDIILGNDKSSISDRKISVECREKAFLAKDNVNSLSKKLVSSADKVDLAQKELSKKLENDSMGYADIKAFYVQLKELEPVIKAVSGSGLKIHL